MRLGMLALALAGVLLATPAAAEPFKVVANPDVPFDTMSRAQLSDLFLKRTTVWPTGAKVEAVDQDEGAPAFDAFCTGVHGKAGTVIRAFWKRVTMSGRDTPPRTGRSDAEVLAVVRSTPGAIGYVSAAADTSGVKVVKVAN